MISTRNVLLTVFMVASSNMFGMNSDKYIFNLNLLLQAHRNGPEFEAKLANRITVRKGTSNDRAAIINLLNPQRDTYEEVHESMEELIDWYLNKKSVGCLGWGSRGNSLVAEQNKELCAVMLYSIVNDRFCWVNRGRFAGISLMAIDTAKTNDEQKYVTALIETIQNNPEQYDGLKASRSTLSGNATCNILQRNGFFDNKDK